MIDERGKKHEEAYFHAQDRKLLEKLRAKADKERLEEEKKHRKAKHWMKCPKCGHDLREEPMGQVKVDRCGECGGLYLDAGELDILLAANRGTSLARWFGKK